LSKKEIDQAITDKLLPESFVELAASAPDTELDISLAAGMAAVIFLVTFKNLTSSNYEGYKRDRQYALNGCSTTGRT